MKRGIYVGSLAASLLFGVSAQADAPPLDALLKTCEEKTIVLGWDEQGKAVKVGESIDGYCKGFLEGMLAALVRAKMVCLKDKDTSPYFLLSSVLTYRAETKSQDNDAAMVIEAAFRRAFSCSK
jgi:hypothetical protein